MWWRVLLVVLFFAFRKRSNGAGAATSVTPPSPSPAGAGQALSPVANAGQEATEQQDETELDFRLMARNGAFELCFLVLVAGAGAAFWLERPYLVLGVTAATVAGLLAAPDALAGSGLVYLLTGAFLGLLWLPTWAERKLEDELKAAIESRDQTAREEVEKRLDDLTARRQKAVDRYKKRRKPLIYGAMLVAVLGVTALNFGLWLSLDSSHPHQGFRLGIVGAIACVAGILVAFPVAVFGDFLDFQSDANGMRHDLSELRKHLGARFSRVALGTVVAFIAAAVLTILDAQEKP